MDAPLPHTIGRYRIIERLGQGSMGIVYRGRDESLDRDVALKVMSGGESGDADARARFEREARAAARLQHPNIVTIYELGAHRGAPFIAMELLEGIDLQRAIASGLRPNPRVTFPIVLQLLAGLEHAHNHGIVHRDIKPSNVFLPRGLPAKIMDFGVARLSGGGTTAGTIVGTPNYMSPEQVRGAKLDGRSDIFSAGLILYELVTGERAYTGSTVVSVLYKIANESPDLSLLPRETEWATLREVAARALAREPAKRYRDARAMAAELSQALMELGGGADWTTASDRGLLVRHTPRPARPAELDPLTIPPADLVPDPAPMPEPTEPVSAVAPAVPATLERPPRPAAFWGLLALGLVSSAVLVAGLLVLSQRSAPEPAVPRAVSTPPAGAAATATATEKPTAPPSPQPQIPTTPEATPVVTPKAPLQPTPPPAPDPDASLDRANALLEAGRYQSALTSARAILAREPANEEARDIAEEAEAGLVVEKRLRDARELLRRGEREAALTEVQAGLAVRPTDARLLALFRELTQ